jgi:hypothetical protein
MAAIADARIATDLLSHISGSVEVVGARLGVAHAEATLIIENRWREVTVVAKALREHKTLAAKQVREIILKGIGTAL